MKPVSRAIIAIFKYLEPVWLDSDNKKMSLRSVGAIALITDFIINLHNSALITVRVLDLIYKDKSIEATLIAAMAGNLAQITMMLGIEAGLIAALLAIKYEAFKKPIDVDITVPLPKKTTILTNPNQEEE